MSSSERVSVVPSFETFSTSVHTGIFSPEIVSFSKIIFISLKLFNLNVFSPVFPIPFTGVGVLGTYVPTSEACSRDQFSIVVATSIAQRFCVVTQTIYGVFERGSRKSSDFISRLIELSSPARYS